MELDVSYNDLSAVEPSLLCTLNNLTHVNLYQTNLTKAQAQALFTMLIKKTKLIGLNISRSVYSKVENSVIDVVKSIIELTIEEENKFLTWF